MEAMDNEVEESIDELWNVSYKQEPSLKFFETNMQSAFILNHVYFKIMFVIYWQPQCNAFDNSQLLLLC